MKWVYYTWYHNETLVAKNFIDGEINKLNEVKCNET